MYRYIDNMITTVQEVVAGAPAEDLKRHRVAVRVQLGAEELAVPPHGSRCWQYSFKNSFVSSS